MGGVDHPFQRGVVPIQQHHDLELAQRLFPFAHALQQRAQAVDAEELEARREGEVLLQQPVAFEVAQIVGQQRLFGGEAFLPQPVQRQRAPLRLRLHRLADKPDAVLHQQFQQLLRLHVRPGQVKHQLIQLQVVERHAFVALETNAQRADTAAVLQPQRGQRNIGRNAAQLDAGDAHRLQRDVMGGGVAAGDAAFLQRLAVHHGAARHHEAVADVAFAAVRLQLGDRHRRRRRQVIGVDDLQQALRKARELGVHFQLHARGEEGEALHQALDIGIRHVDAAHAETARDLRILFGELGAHLTQIGQLAVVIV